MHELSICLALMEQVGRISAEHGGRRVASILLRVGPLSGVEPPLLERAFPLAAAGTIAEDAELVIEQAAVRVGCSRCGAETEASPNRLLCGRCGDYRTRLVSGDEMLLASLELELDDAPAAGADPGPRAAAAGPPT
jgi:hydrogenase nickel incorporation protein HypA/HybF